MFWKRDKDKKEIVAVLGVGAEFEGKLLFHGAVRIDGKFKGSIKSDGTLIVGDSGIINGDAEVDIIIVSGEFNGEINAKTRVELRNPGKMFGNITTHALIVEEGFRFEGNCKMSEKKAELEKEDKKISVVKMEAKNP